MALLQSEIEGKYEILEKIKEGGMGAVYKVRHRILDEVRVVKVIRSSLEPTTELSDRFLREARMAIRLRHPNIAALHDFAIAEGGNAYIVMEYIEGLTLEDILRARGTPPLGLTLEIAQQSLKAIGYLHRRGFVHRDIAPDNLMLTRGIDGEPLVKLIDLGIAKVLAGEGDFTSTGMFLGKPRYASPEHFGAEGGIDGRSDLYSFGIVLYELATGQAPVVGRDPASFMAGHLLRPPRAFAETDPSGRVPSDLRELLLLALAKRSAERIASAEEFARRLAPAIARFPVQEGDLEKALQPPSVDGPARPPASADDGSTQDRLDRQFGNFTTPPPELRGPTLAAGEGSSLPFATASGAAAQEPDWQTHLLQPAAPSTRANAAARSTPVHDVTWRSSVSASGGSGAAGVDEERGAWVKLALGLALLVAALGGGLWWYMHPSEPALGEAAAGEPGSRPAAPPRAGADAPSASPLTAAPGTPAAPASKPAGGSSAPASNPAGGSSSMAVRGTGLPAAGPGMGPARPARAAQAAGPAPGAQAAGRAPGVAAAGPRAALAEGEPVARSASPKSSGASPVETSQAGIPGAEREAERAGLIIAGPGVEIAEPTSIPDAVYPSGAMGSGLQPRVLVAVLIDEKGNVAEARVKSGDSSGLGFNEAALAAVKRARFLPATRNGVPGRSWSELIIEFTSPP